MRYRKVVSLALVSLVYATAAQAGAPLKGVDVKLGKNPGGTIASRTTDAGGKADFGPWPVLGNGAVYTMTIGSVDEPVTVTITGVRGGPLVREVASAGASARAATSVSFASDGETPIGATVEVTRVKSHSNSSNN